MKYSIGFLGLVFLVGLLSGAVGGALISAAMMRGLEPPLLSALIPTAVPSPTWTSTPLPTSTPTLTITPPPSTTPTHSPTVFPTITASPTSTSTPRPTLMDIIEDVEPSVVTIAASVLGSEEPQAFGSGVALFDAGIIITNYHVIENAERIEVLIRDEQVVPASLVGADFFTDLAVLRIDPSLGIKPLTLSVNTDLRVGEPVFAIGSALGDFRNSVTTGIVSGLERSVLVDQVGFAYEMLIQTDAAINRGNSGGPLLNAAGEVVGINTLVVRGSGSNGDIEGLGFAVPASMVEKIARLLLQEGKVSRPFFGIRHELLTPLLASQYSIERTRGELILHVQAQSPADDAGIEVGDLLLSINNEGINPRRPFINLLMQYDVGETIEVLLLRDGLERSFFVNLVERQ